MRRPLVWTCSVTDLEDGEICLCCGTLCGSPVCVLVLPEEPSFCFQDVYVAYMYSRQVRKTTGGAKVSNMPLASGLMSTRGIGVKRGMATLSFVSVLGRSRTCHCSRFQSHLCLILQVDPKLLLYVPLGIKVCVWSADASLLLPSRTFISVMRCPQPF